MALVKDDVVKKWKIKLSVAPTPFVSVHRHGISFKINVYAIYILKCWLYVTIGRSLCGRMDTSSVGIEVVIV
jgi:hypothetical protein